MLDYFRTSDLLVINDTRVIRVSEFFERDNVALRCARRAMEIEARGQGERHRDVTPIYVRLAEAEVKLQQRQKA